MLVGGPISPRPTDVCGPLETAVPATRYSRPIAGSISQW